MNFKTDLDNIICYGTRTGLKDLFIKYDKEQVLSEIKNRLYKVALHDNLEILNGILEYSIIQDFLRKDQDIRKNLLSAALRSSSYDFVAKLLELDCMAIEIKNNINESINLVASNIKETSQKTFDLIIEAIDDNALVESSFIQLNANAEKFCPVLITAHIYNNDMIEFKLLNFPQIFAYADEFYDAKDSSFSARDIINKFIPQYFKKLDTLKSKWSDEHREINSFDLFEGEAELGFLVLKHLLRIYPLREQMLAKENAKHWPIKDTNFQMLFNKFRCAYKSTKNDIFLERINILLAIPSIRTKVTANLEELLNIKFNNHGVDIPLNPELKGLINKFSSESNVKQHSNLKLQTI